MQQDPPPYPQPQVVRRKYARRRFRDRKGVRRAHTSVRGLLTGGAALILLGGSQAGLSAVGHFAGHHSGQSGSSIDGGSPPLGLGTPPPPGTGTLGPTQSPSPGPGGGSPVTAGGGRIPATVLAAYLSAQQRLASSDPGCHLPWQLLAGIGEVESGQAEGGDVTADGTARTPILGPLLNGQGFAAIHSGNGSWARAEGPMQFIPSTWATWGVDGNGDGKADPENVYDAALAAADYLCSGGRDLSRQADLNQAILGYNDSQAYLADVLAWMRYYQQQGALPGTPAGGGPWVNTGGSGSTAGAPPAGGGTPGSTPGQPGSSTGGGSKSTGGGPTSGPGGSGGGSGTGSGTVSGGGFTGPGGSPSRSPQPSSSAGAGSAPSPTSPSPSPSSSSPTPSPSPTCSSSPTASSSATSAASPTSSTSPSPTPTTSTSSSPSASSSASASAAASSSSSPSPSPTCS